MPMENTVATSGKRRSTRLIRQLSSQEVTKPLPRSLHHQKSSPTKTSPLKASIKAAKHICEKARRVPLSNLIDKIERTARSITASPATVLPKQHQPRRPEPIVPALQVRKQMHTSKHVCELYEAYTMEQEVEEARSKTASSLALPRSSQQPPKPVVSSFLELLKAHYPSYSRSTLEMMVRDAKDGIERIDQRQFIARAKGRYADRLRLAFVETDKDKSGGLSVEEFIKAVDGTGAQPPGYSGTRPASRSDLRGVVRKIFTEGDANADGILDFDEFLGICAKQPWLVGAFDKIVDIGVRRKLKNEEHRLRTIFRVPISPRSRCVVGTDGERFRPGLFDLRRVDDVGELLSRAEQSASRAGNKNAGN